MTTNNNTKCDTTLINVTHQSKLTFGSRTTLRWQILHANWG